METRLKTFRTISSHMYATVMLQFTLVFASVHILISCQRNSLGVLDDAFSENTQPPVMAVARGRGTEEKCSLAVCMNFCMVD